MLLQWLNKNINSLKIQWIGRSYLWACRAQISSNSGNMAMKTSSKMVYKSCWLSRLFWRTVKSRLAPFRAFCLPTILPIVSENKPVNTHSTRSRFFKSYPLPGNHVDNLRLASSRSLACVAVLRASFGPARTPSGQSESIIFCNAKTIISSPCKVLDVSLNFLMFSR